MSIRINSRISTAPFDAFADALDNFNEIVDRVGRDVYEDYQGPMLAALQQQPGPVKYPIQWTSEKQRRAFFATDGFGRGIGAPRTGAMAAAWEVRFIETPGSFQIVVINPSKAAKFVEGSLAKNAAAAARFQQSYHRNTGWQLASPIVQNYLDAMTVDFKFRFKQELDDFGSTTGSGRRAYTGR